MLEVLGPEAGLLFHSSALSLELSFGRGHMHHLEGLLVLHLRAFRMIQEHSYCFLSPFYFLVTPKACVLTIFLRPQVLAETEGKRLV